MSSLIIYSRNIPNFQRFTFPSFRFCFWIGAPTTRGPSNADFKFSEWVRRHIWPKLTISGTAAAFALFSFDIFSSHFRISIRQLRKVCRAIYCQNRSSPKSPKMFIQRDTPPFRLFIVTRCPTWAANVTALSAIISTVLKTKHKISMSGWAVALWGSIWSLHRSQVDRNFVRLSAWRRATGKETNSEIETREHWLVIKCFISRRLGLGPIGGAFNMTHPQFRFSRST
jgi:hypothetical protein